jgi:opacity protein-like surface antigen
MPRIARMLLVAVTLASSAATALAQTPTPSTSTPMRSGVSGIEAMTATIFQEGQSSFSGLAVRVRVHSPRFIEQVSFLPTIEYWRNSSKVEPWGIRTTRKDATLALDARYDFRQGGWQPYLGAGFGIHFFSNKVDAPSLGLEDTDSVTKGGLSFLGGLQFGITDRLSNLMELKYHHVPDHSQVKINWGLSYSL